MYIKECKMEGWSYEDREMEDSEMEDRGINGG